MPSVMHLSHLLSSQLIAVATDVGVLLYRVGASATPEKIEMAEELLLHFNTADTGGDDT